MREIKERDHSGKSKLVGLLLPTLVFCLVVKTALVGFYFYHGLGSISWPPLAQAANDTKSTTPAGKAFGKENEGLTELLKKKEEQLLLKEQELQQKEAELQLLEKEVSAKLAEVATLQEKLADELEDFQRKVKEREEALKNSRIKYLVDVYKAMEPAKAVQLLDKLDDDITLQIITRMKGRVAAQILANMEPKRAARISKRLSESDQ